MHFFSNKDNLLCKHDGGPTMLQWLLCVLSTLWLPFRYNARALFPMAVVTNRMCGKSPTYLRADYTEEYSCKGKKKLRTWAALGSKTTLIGFGQVILTKGTPLWQSWQPGAWIIKTLLCHIRLLPITRATYICSLRALRCSRVKLCKNLHSAFTINGPNHSVLQ